MQTSFCVVTGAWMGMRWATVGDDKTRGSGSFLGSDHGLAWHVVTCGRVGLEQTEEKQPVHNTGRLPYCKASGSLSCHKWMRQWGEIWSLALQSSHLQLGFLTWHCSHTGQSDSSLWRTGVSLVGCSAASLSFTHGIKAMQFCRPNINGSLLELNDKVLFKDLKICILGITIR